MKFFERSQITAAWSAATARSIDAPRPHVTSYVTALAKEFANGTVTYARDKRAAKAKMVGAIARSSCFWSAWWGWCVPRFHGRQYTASESEYVGASAGTRSG